MIRIIMWISKNKVKTIELCVVLFALPVLIIHVLFKIPGCEYFRAEWSAGDILGYIAGFEAFVGTISLGMLSLWQNEKINNEHVASLEPCLSMKLVSIEHCLYLIVENNGQTPATYIEIEITNISNNGDYNYLPDGRIFGDAFDLYPGEMVQSQVELLGATMVQDAFPKVTVHISYIRPGCSERREYDRIVAYSDGYDKKIIADVNYDSSEIHKDIKSIAQSTVRIANYLDAHQLCAFDDINLLTDNSLRNDLVEAIKAKKAVPLTNREETIRWRFVERDK